MLGAWGVPGHFKGRGSYSASILPWWCFCCETKLEGLRAKSVIRRLGFANGGFFLNYEASKGGLLILWKDDVDLSIVGYSTGHIDSEIVDKEGLRCRFTWVYGHSNKNERMHTWEHRAYFYKLS
ncbi:hypothetical protein TIFTF001_033418 [Ficus carica]|uniref:Uncharacterized protein n=1 Tax=Ficus carica TaxID=3494 RepID=A0AA88DYV6_FICCA|nr:hypothetical protein TIFTF001_033418 [Ficus carica]